MDIIISEKGACLVRSCLEECLASDRPLKLYEEKLINASYNTCPPFAIPIVQTLEPIQSILLSRVLDKFFEGYKKRQNQHDKNYENPEDDNESS